MEKNLISVDPRVLGLREDFEKRYHNALKLGDEQFFDYMEAFSKADYQQREVFIKEVLKKDSKTITFIVGEVFKHRNKDCVPQYHGTNFQNWMWTLAKEKVVAISAFGKNNLKEYVLSRNMNDTTIQSNANSTPISEDQFWAILYLLIINQKLGKKFLKYELRKDKVYIFHVKLASGKVVAVDVFWAGGEWVVNARGFAYGGLRDGGNVFLFPATA